MVAGGHAGSERRTHDWIFEHRFAARVVVRRDHEIVTRDAQAGGRSDTGDEGFHQGAVVDVELFDGAVEIVVGRQADQQVAVAIEQHGRGLRRQAGRSARAQGVRQVDELAAGGGAIVVADDLVVLGRLEAKVEIGDQQVAIVGLGEQGGRVDAAAGREQRGRQAASVILEHGLGVEVAHDQVAAGREGQAAGRIAQAERVGAQVLLRGRSGVVLVDRAAAEIGHVQVAVGPEGQGAGHGQGAGVPSFSPSVSRYVPVAL